jgi:hypothetical protein
MCYHCNDWWPLNELGRAVLGLDPNTPYWLHGVWLNDLAEACALALRPEPAPVAAGVGDAINWLRARNPGYAGVVDRLVPREGRPADFLQLVDICTCEIPLAFSHVNRASSLRQTAARDETRPPTEAPGTYGQFLDECPGELGALWATTAPGVATPLKKGQMWLDRAAAERPDLYDPLHFRDVA